MKYSNSLKYMESFGRAGSGETSQKRFRSLCQRLGRVELGARYICLPAGSVGYATALMLSKVISKAGYRVGLISSAFAYDSRLSITVGGEIPSIDDYNTAVAELKDAIGRAGVDEHCREEAVFALGLLLCKICGCEYVILQGLSDKRCTLDAICAPYELIVVPTYYDATETDGRIKSLCELIRRGVREVVSGNQKSEIYNVISNACATRGVRLSIPLKAQFSVSNSSVRSTEFVYGERDSIKLRSPSLVLHDCAMTVIESALALRRGGVKLPWSSIAEGIESVRELGCFDLLSLSPLLLIDGASRLCEANLLIETARVAMGENALQGVSLCLPRASEELVSAFESVGVGEVIFYSEEVDGADKADLDSYKKCAKEVVRLTKEGRDVICLGSVDFAFRIKSEINKIL